MSNNVNIGALSIMYVVINKRENVIAFLLKNGVQVPSTISDIDLGLIVTNMLKNSKAFARDFEQLISKKEVVVGVFSGFDGAYSNAFGDKNYFSNLPKFDSNLFSTSTPSTPSVENKSTSQNGFWTNALNTLQTGFQGYLALDANKTQRELANASVQIKQGDVQLADRGILPAGNVPNTPQGLSTGAIVGLSILGISIIGLVTYLALKKQ